MKTPRQRDLARIHLLKAQLGLDDETYRAMLHAVARVDSARDLDEHGRQAVIRQLESKLSPTARFAGKPNTADRPQIKKIEALLADMKLPWSYALAIAKRQCGKARLEFCSTAELTAVIAALVRAQARHKSNPTVA